MARKKILMTIWGGGGGADTVSRNNANELRRRGIGTDILTHHYNPPFNLVADGISRQLQDTDSVVGIDWNRYAVLHNNVCAMGEAELRGIQQRNERMPHLYTAHSLLRHQGCKADAPETMKQQSTIARADRVLHMTSHGVDAFGRHYPEYAGKALALPHGSDFYKHDTPAVRQRTAEIRRELGGGNIIFYAGRFDPQKGISTLTDAYQMMKTSHPEAKLLLLGGHGDVDKLVYGRLRDDARRDVRVHGWTANDAEIAAHYAAADIVAVPSYNETFCMTALEAMMLGTPVAISNVDGPARVWVGPGLAYGFEPGNAKSIADRLNRVLADPNRTANAARVQQVVRDRYSLKHVMDAYVALYDHEMRQKRADVPASDQLIDPKDSEQCYAALAELSGDERFRGMGQKPRTFATAAAGIVNALRTEAPEDRLARRALPGAQRTNERSNGTSQSVTFYETPGPRSGTPGKGIVIKKIPPQEADVLRAVPSHMNGKYRIPAVLGWDRDAALVAQQRIYGPTMLDIMIRNPETSNGLMMAAAEWLKQFQGRSREELPYDLSASPGYCSFMGRMQRGAGRFRGNPEYERVGQLLEEKWKQKRPLSPSGWVHGDMSPTHLLYEDGVLYGIDFNASHRGPTNEDPGMFLGNLVYHLACEGAQQARINETAAQFMHSYGTPIETGFYLSNSYLAKANAEPHPGGLLRAARRVLERPLEYADRPFDINA